MTTHFDQLLRAAFEAGRERGADEECHLNRGSGPYEPEFPDFDEWRSVLPNLDTRKSCPVEHCDYDPTEDGQHRHPGRDFELGDFVRVRDDVPVEFDQIRGRTVMVVSRPSGVMSCWEVRAKYGATPFGVPKQWLEHA